ncbi:MAG: lamin tail domain-containing protein, partial [bacterium]|nr:lamin tail domain-containing protein [bacterium]
TDSSVTGGTTYFYVVRAIDTSANESGNSNEDSATPTGGGGGGGPAGVLLSEVLYDVSSGDDGFEWVELFNSSTSSVDLSGFCLGGGGTDYTYSSAQLSGSIASGATFVVGGPTSSATNANPSFDLLANFNQDLQNSGSTGDGVALFDVACAQVNGSTVPVDAVVYGPNNNSGLIDETGSANAPEVGDAPANSSIERVDLGGTWTIQGSPTPNATTLPPPSGCSVNADCDDGAFCNGAEVCNAGTCEAGTPPSCDDGTFCNGTETCNESTDSCDAGTPPACDDGLFCNGTETCNEASDSCEAGAPPACDDGLFCNGAETCNETADSCDAGSAPCDPGTETCNEGADTCDPIGGGPGNVVLSEVLYDVSSGDDGFEWVELYNSSTSAVDLSGYCIGGGGTDYTYSSAQLSGTIASGATFVIGGPTSSSVNANPSFDLVVNFNQDLQNSGTTGDGVALFDVACASVNGSTQPIDAVIYGPNNNSNLIDETGSANA